MCRVLIATKRAVKEYNSRHGLKNLLKHLEQELGGHGNGLALFDENGKMTYMQKGVKYNIN